MPLLTVILPAHNAPGTLPLAVSSVLRALPRDSELVIMDDGSRIPVEAGNGIPADPRIRVLRNEVPVGAGAASQLLLDATDSRYVSRMDHDDVTLPWRFRHQLAVLRDSSDFVFSPIVQFRTRPLRLRPGAPLPITADAMPLHLLVQSLLCHPTMTATRAAIEAAGGYRAVRAEDYDLWLRASAAGQRIVRTALPVLGYRRHPTQMSFQPRFAKDDTSSSLLREAYQAFVMSRFGVQATWTDALWSARSGDPDVIEGLAPLFALVDSRAAALSPLQRLVWRRSRGLLEQRLVRPS